VALVLGGTQALVSSLALLAIGAGTTAILLAVAVYVGAACVAIAVFDTRLSPARAAAAEVVGASVRRRRPRGSRWARALLLVLVGAAAGLSPFFFAYYSPGYWVPGGLALLALAAGVAVARPVRPSAPQALALAGLAGLAAVALASTAWSPAVEQAMVGGNRYAALAALLGVLVLLVRTPAHARTLLAAVTVTGCATALVVVGRLLAGDEGLFLGSRLNGPLGYVNGEAGFFLLLAWPCLAAAEQRRSRLLAAAGLAGATVLAGLIVLSQSRGATLAAIVAVAAVVILVPGRLHRITLLAVLGACLAPALPLLVDVFQVRADGAAGTAEMQRAALILLLGAAVAGAAAAMIAAVPTLSRVLRPVTVAAMAVAVLALGGFALTSRAELSDRIQEQVDAFRSPGTDDPSAHATRLASGAGNRYDYWRIAWRVWRDDPLHGIGAGGYEVPYFRQRATAEDIRQPHSLELQTLSELGLLGTFPLLAFLGAVGWGALRTVRAARRSPEAQLLAVGGIGAFAAWLAQTSVDWLHLLPGVTAVALAAAACLLVSPAPPPARSRTPRRVRLVPAIAVALALVTAGVSLSRQLLADEFRNQARASLRTDPAKALREADRSLRIVPDAIGSYHVKSAALARFGEGDAARAVLLEALRRKPEDWVTWALLGDLETRRGERAAAARAYGRAVALNPRDRGLRALRDEARR
jgi:hypothetical protein